MLSWKDVIAVQEHHKELLREAEQARLIQQAKAGAEEGSVWQRVKGLFAGMNKSEEPAEETSCNSSFETAC
ncbi:MAG: hypothetical protein HYR94_10310 [Chloroflexi bacterium]|nr:hypothetical protein [Chloroflexota bacterium]